MNRSLKDFLLYGAVIGTAVMLLIMFVGITLGYEWYVTKQTAQKTEKTAEVKFQSLYELMRKGWTGEQLEEFLSANQNTYEEINMQVNYYGLDFRGDNGLSPAIADTFNSGEVKHIQDGRTVTYIYPMTIETGCLSCHYYATVGEVFGVLEVSEDLTPIVMDARRDTLLYLLSLFPIPIIGAYLISRYLGRRIDESIYELQKRIQKVKSTDDLRLIEMNNINLTFSEMNQMYSDIKALATRLKSICVDKDILEFEVQLLEKFVITSEVVKDWKEHVKMLMLEINKIMDVHIIFSLFKVEDEDYVLEVFWIHTPNEKTKKTFEQVIRNKLLASSLHKGSEDITLEINHNVALSIKELETIDEESIDFQTKSLFLETPRIGGIVGIGVNSSLTENTTKALVIESILTTLLNVIGSVKAVSKYTKELEYFATRDPLTNLYTQRVFWELLSYEVLRASRHGYKFAVIVIDLDDFKLVNDLHGHLFGDKYLQEVAKITKDVLRKGDVLSRYGGDEYTIILPYADQEQAHFVGTRLLDKFRNFTLEAPNGSKVKISASIGIAIYPDHASEAKDLVLIADNMMYKAKNEGKDKVGLPDSDDVLEIFKTIKDKNTLILNALEENKVIPFFQPIVDAKTGEELAKEVLMRIDLPKETMVASDFVEIAESMGIISKLDYMLMDKALKKVSEEGYEGYIYFNLSPKALIVSDFVPKVRKLVKEHGVDPKKIVFEITERDTVKNLTVLEKFVLQLKGEGFQFAIDDFGSGFSSFQYIKRLPIDIIKIEGDFIRNIHSKSGMDKAIVLSIVTLARELNIKTIAEFVEDDKIYNEITELGIDYAQGYYVGRPSAQLNKHTGAGSSDA
ncbi:putative bifunctional diguanylate cyclase/phosphodiesterase [Desulfuribacillus alkaliarsenatis]|uniref:Diguanylate cyclase n=1 Tax=Desulfuribacillus alkaliarsenatis TaxID=766136 RepID=A0A1E5G3A3_9FIRM|nr:bifunctional diguanylate cyclase/phosphodiesterase [Desulfuribacillus alkaliarsenatis]OEF97538.1 hypothetical protein BHF68_04855 [Desulfuribacillus alkaliarsenatis]